jgi:hypothetical protein
MPEPDIYPTEARTRDGFTTRGILMSRRVFVPCCALTSHAFQQQQIDEGFTCEREASRSLPGKGPADPEGQVCHRDICPAAHNSVITLKV